MANIHDIARRAMVPSRTDSLIFKDASTTQLTPQERRMILDSMHDDSMHDADFIAEDSLHVLGDTATRTLGLIVPLRGAIFLNHFVAEVLAGIQTSLMERNYHLMIYSHGSPTGGLTDTERRQSRRSDGVIVLNTRLSSEQDMRDTIDDLHSASVPFVMVNGRPQGSDFSYVGVDEFEVGRIAGEYLISEGHRRIAMLGGSQRNPNGRLLRDGMVEACRRHKLAARFPLHDYTDYEPGRIEHIVSAWMSARQPPTALCCDDQMAYAVYETLDSLGLSVPSDVAVLGRGDLTLASSLKPKLTTVRIPAMEIGRLAAEELIAQIEHHGAPPRQILLPCAVTARDSA